MTENNRSEKLVLLARVAVLMADAGLPSEFVASALRAGDRNEGVHGLMLLWSEVEGRSDRMAIVADIQDLIDDLQPSPGPHQRPKVPFEDLDKVVTHVHAHKQKLRELIDQHGGVSEVARRTGIPQPSLSRMLSSGSMPRRTTLFKIATALGLRESDIVAEWTQ